MQPNVAGDSAGVADDSAREILDALFEQLKAISRPPEPYAGIESSDAFSTKAVGTSFEARQEIVGGLQAGQETVELVRESDNPVDANAIAVRFGTLRVDFLRKESP